MIVYTYNDKVLVNSANDKWLKKKDVDPYNPLGLPAGVMRFEATSGWTPSGYDTMNLEFTQVSSSPNIWDLHILNGNAIANGATGSMTKLLGFNATGLTNYSSALHSRIYYSKGTLTECGPMYLPGYTGSTSNNGSLFNDCQYISNIGKLYTPDLTGAINMFYSCKSLTTVPLFDTSSVTNMSAMFVGCTSLTTIPLFDTSNVTNMSNMFNGCTSLTTVPLFDTSSVTNMEAAFYGCTNVESGALALYQQASMQANPPSNHGGTFTNCGSNTVTGAAELAQIPSSWGGTAT